MLIEVLLGIHGEAIKTRNLGADRVKEARLQTLITKFENLKISDDIIDAYDAKLSALEQVLDLKTIGFEDMFGRLKAYEERVKEEDKANDPQENLLYGIEVSQGKDCLQIKQERYAMKILKEAGMEDCNPALCPMEPRLKLSKADDEPEVEATQYQKMGNDMRLVGYSSHNVDIDDGRSTIGHFEDEFMTDIAAACQVIWLRKVLAEVMEIEQVIVEHVSGENQYLGYELL
nr:hypothetical protein [Tanacetum cinerariifolium]